MQGLEWLIQCAIDDQQHPEVYATFRQLPKFAAEILAGLMEIAFGDEQAQVDTRQLSPAAAIILGNLLSVAGRHDEADTLMNEMVRLHGETLGIDNARYSILCRRKGMSDDLSEKFCPWPYRYFGIVEDGAVNACCSAWLPTQIGNIRHMGWAEIWNSATAQKVRKSVHDGSFRYCNKMLCPRIQCGLASKQDYLDAGGDNAKYVSDDSGYALNAPEKVDLSFDKTCNLSCPSCRTNVIAMPRHEREGWLRDVETKILPLLEKVSSTNVTGSGDPFASALFRNLLEKLTPERFPNLKVKIATNAALFTPSRWEKIAHLAGRIGWFTVSVDAAKPETYDFVRRGGDWYALMENLEFAADLKRKNLIDTFNLGFVVQAANWQEIPAFVELGRHLGVDDIHFSCLQNWGTRTAIEFAREAVHLSTHPEHEAFLTLVAHHPLLEDPIVTLGDLNQFRPKASGIDVATGKQRREAS